MNNSQPQKRRGKFRHKGLVLAASSGATASLLLSLEDGKVGRFEFLRAGISAAVAALAFAQTPRDAPSPRPNRDDG